MLNIALEAQRSSSRNITFNLWNDYCFKYALSYLTASMDCHMYHDPYIVGYHLWILGQALDPN